jgi:putative addiction module antidote
MHTVKLKIRRQGNSLGITLPKAMTDALDLREGDEVHVTQTMDGIVVRPHDEAFGQAMEAADRVFRRYRNTLKALADS